MILEEEKQYVEPVLAQKVMDAGMPPGLYCWKPMPGCNEESPDWELLYGNSDNFFGAIDTWNVGEMRHWLHSYNMFSNWYPFPIMEPKEGNYAYYGEWVTSHITGKWIGVEFCCTDSDVTAHGLTCLALLKALKKKPEERSELYFWKDRMKRLEEHTD